jgi:hypothetical protein
MASGVLERRSLLSYEAVTRRVRTRIREHTPAAGSGLETDKITGIVVTEIIRHGRDVACGQGLRGPRITRMR